MKCNKSNLIIGLAALFFSILLGMGFITFEVWGQIVDYRAGFESSGGFYFSPHILRYIVIHPAYELASFFGLTVNAVYSWYIILSSVFVGKIWDLIRKKSNGSWSGFSLILLIPFVLLLVINGRFIFGLLGLTILLYCSVIFDHEKLGIQKLIVIAVGLLFTSVSSGIFIVGVVFIFLSIVDAYRRKPRFIGLGMKTLLLVLMLLCFFMVLVFLQKNIDYFVAESGSIFGMLTHGIGFLFLPNPYQELCGSGVGGAQCTILSVLKGELRVLSALIVISFLVFAFYILVKLSRISKLAVRGLFISVLGGFFGFTTLMSFIFVIPVLFVDARASESSGDM